MTAPLALITFAAIVFALAELANRLEAREVDRRVLVVVVAEQREDSLEYAREQLGGETERRWLN